MAGPLVRGAAGRRRGGGPRPCELIDGGVVSTTNLDIAVEASAKFVVVYPLVPYVNDFQRSVLTLRGARPRHCSYVGFPQIGYEAVKLARLPAAARDGARLGAALSRRRDRADRARANDELMFEIFDHELHLADRRRAPPFQSVTLKLAGEYEDIRTICARHGIETSGRGTQRDQALRRGEEKTRAWRKILEQTIGARLLQPGEALSGGRALRLTRPRRRRSIGTGVVCVTPGARLAVE